MSMQLYIPFTLALLYFHRMMSNSATVTTITTATTPLPVAKVG